MDDLVKIFIKGKNETSCILVRFMTQSLTTEEYSNNQCEWRALVMAMKYILDNDLKTVVIYTDSSLLIKQLRGLNRIKSKQLKPLYFEWNVLKNLLYQKNIKYMYIHPTDNPARKYI